MPLHTATPAWRSAPLSQSREVWLKLEHCQPSGSFKIRGIGRLCEQQAALGKRRFVASSGGNAGLAVAYAARELGLAATIYVPETTSPLMREKIVAMGAEVVVAGSAWDQSDQHARQRAESAEVAYIPPFDHPAIWQGHATLVEESIDQIPQPELVLVAVGGGGLLCGVAAGLRAGNWRGVELVAVETCGAASLAAAVSAGRPVSIARIDSVATTLGARRVCQGALDVVQRQPTRLAQVSDAAAVAACLRFADDHGVLVEPACGAALSLVYDDHAVLGQAQRVAVVVCGGAGVSRALLARWAEQFSLSC
ncbi:MAG: pyridoxal-phosphate dependent enzyme [Deltaproteobacteria bacterium]|nr:pyridoxal-phosphate dependent enzyme [Deltaproteobacteria bacterium]